MPVPRQQIIEQGRHVIEVPTRHEVEHFRLQRIDAGIDEIAVRRLLGQRGNAVALGLDHAIGHLELVFAHAHGGVGAVTGMKVQQFVEAGAGDQIAVHDVVAHGIGEYVRGNVHTNTIENYFSVLKRGLTGTYQHVGKEHLKRYLCEFDFRYNYRVGPGYSDEDRTKLALQGIEGKRLTYLPTTQPHQESQV